jgi:hypothetical protein
MAKLFEIDLDREAIMIKEERIQSNSQLNPELEIDNLSDGNERPECMSVIAMLMKTISDGRRSFSESKMDSNNERKEFSSKHRIASSDLSGEPFELSELDRKTLREALRHAEFDAQFPDAVGASASMQLMLSNCKQKVLEMKRNRRREQKYKKILGFVIKKLMKEYYSRNKIRKCRYGSKPVFIAELFEDLSETFKHKFQRDNTYSDISITCKFNKEFFKWLKGKSKLIDRLIEQVLKMKSQANDIFNQDFDRFVAEMLRWVAKNGGTLAAASTYFTDRTMRSTIHNGRSQPAYNRSKRMGVRLPWPVQELVSACDFVITELFALR